MKLDNKKTIEERKVDFLIKKLEESTGKKVVLKEDDEELRSRGIKNSIEWINSLKSSSWNLYQYSKNSNFGKEKFSKYTSFFKKVYDLAEKLEDNLG